MLKSERYRYIMDYLNDSKFVKVGFLSHSLNVTQETVRRDLEYLEQQGKIKRVHGGAVLQHKSIKETNFTLRESINIEEKQMIAKSAIRFVKEGSLLALDVSTTNSEIAKELVKNFNHLSVVTNSLSIATILSENPHFHIYLPSGKLRNSELCIVGNSCISYINNYNIDVFFMSVSGISLERGFTDYGDGEYEVKMAMLKNSNKVFAVADHTKFDAVAMMKIGDLQLANGIITDSNIDSNIVKQYKVLDIPIFLESD